MKSVIATRLLKIRNGIVSEYFDFAQAQALCHNPMYMSDYVKHLDNNLLQ